MAYTNTSYGGLPPNYYSGSAVPLYQQVNTGTRQSGYGSGLGGIQQFGYGNPMGPYAGLSNGWGSAPATGGTTAPATGGGTGAAESTARKYLEGVVQGQNTPYNEATRNSMYSRASGMNAAAEGAQNRQISEQAAMGGASPRDPSYAGLMRQSMAQRQGANMQAAGDIDRTANLANQEAQYNAASRLMGSEDERYALQQGFNERASARALGYLFGSGGVNNGPNSPSNQFW